MNVLRNDPPRAEAEGEDGFVSLETIAEQADIVTFHTPLTKEGRFATRHLAGEDFFRKLQRKPWFVNASRGTVHDTKALLHARKEGKISELILDCWENEPDIHQELLETGCDSHPAYCRLLGRRESQRYAYVPGKYRKILPGEDREDRRSGATSSRNSDYRLKPVRQKPDRTGNPNQLQPACRRPGTTGNSRQIRVVPDKLSSPKRIRCIHNRPCDPGRNRTAPKIGVRNPTITQTK